MSIGLDRLCVGATSRLVVEEAAKLGVVEIVASTRQVDATGGYTGLDQFTLVDVVRRLSNGRTQVVRDHGGPGQNGDPLSDGLSELRLDVEAGFDALHLDVCKVNATAQHETLVALVAEFGNRPGLRLEVGAEHATHMWNTSLYEAVSASVRAPGPATLVLGAGTRVWADRQVGALDHATNVRSRVDAAHREGLRVKLHNADWLGYRERTQVAQVVDRVNIAPELGCVEVDALLSVLPSSTSMDLLAHAYATGLWSRWFHDDEGTVASRSRCALRYLLNTDYVRDRLSHALTDAGRTYVRGCVRDAIVNA